MSGKLRCETCGNPSLLLHYGRCPECFSKWKDRNNPEPDAKKKRVRVKCPEKEVRGAFIIHLGGEKYFSLKRKTWVPLDEAHVFMFLSSAEKYAKQNKGKILRMKPVFN